MKYLKLLILLLSFNSIGQNQCFISSISNPVCEGTNASLTVSHNISNPNYLWSFQNQTTQTLILNADSTINVSCIVFNGTDTCTSIFTLNVINVPQIAPISDKIICSGDELTSITFNNSTSNTIFNWNNNNTSIGLTGNGSGNINSFFATNNSTIPLISQITVTPNLYGCIGISTNFSISVKPKPQINQINNQTICASNLSQSIVFNSNLINTTYNWTNSNSQIGLGNSGAGNISPFTTINNTTLDIISTIYVTSEKDGCFGTSINFLITIKPKPVISNQALNSCSNSIINLQNLQGNNIIPANTLYTWNVNTNSAIIGELSNSNASVFYQTLINNTNLDQQIQYLITPSSNSCIGNSFILNINLYATPTIGTINDLEISCLNNLNGNFIGPTSLPGYSYSWSPSNGLSSTNIPMPFANPSSSTQYNLTITDLSNNCTNIRQINVNVNKSSPIVNAGIDANITCNQNTTGVIIGMNSVNGIVYNWSPVNGLNSINTSMTNALPLVNTTYTLYAYNPLNGCTGSDQITINVNNIPPIVYAGNDLTITCNQNQNGVNIGSNTTNGLFYSWTPTNGVVNPNQPITLVNPIVTTTYTLLATNPLNGCSSNDQVIITVNKNSPNAYAGIDAIITCSQNINGAIIGMQPEAGISYSWSPNNNLSSINSSQVIANPSNSSIYTLTAINNVNGCFTTDQILITVNKAIPISNAGLDAVINCNQNQNGLTIGSNSISGLQYSWTPANGLTNVNIANPFANPSITTTYVLNVFNPTNGCHSNDQITISVNNSLPNNFAGIDQIISCNQNQNGVIIGMAPEIGVNYSWTPTLGIQNATSSSTIANPSSSTVYKLTSINSLNGCFTIDSVLISVDNALPSVFAGNDTLLCIGDTLYLNGSSSSINNLWTSTEFIDNQNLLNTFSKPLSTCNYVLTATNNNGCINTDTISVTISQLPSSNLNDSYSLCINDSIQLSIDQSYNCLWGGVFNSTSNIINFKITESGVLNLNLTNIDGCTSSEEILINAKEIPTPNISGNNNLCQNSYWNNYFTPNTNNSIIWTLENGDFMSPNNTNNVLVHWLTGNTGKIVVSETNINGCSNQDSIFVNLSNLALDTININQLSSNVLYINQDFPIIKWGYESINTGVSVEVINNTQYCYFNDIDFTNYYYWVEVAEDVYCTTKSYFNKPNSFLDIDNLLNSEISIFPNPTIDFININNVKSELNYSILDIGNKVVLSGKITNNTLIDIKNLINGVYFLVIDCENIKSSFKIMKL
jgi:hypothetical protein